MNELPVSRQGSQGSCGDVPHPDHVILMARDEPAAIWTERERMGKLSDVGERLNLRPGPRAPELDGSLLDVSEMAACRQPLAVGAQGGGPILARDARQLKDLARRTV